MSSDVLTLCARFWRVHGDGGGPTMQLTGRPAAPDITEAAEAVTNPSGQGDKVLREAGVNDAEDVLARVRMLVGGES